MFIHNRFIRRLNQWSIADHSFQKVTYESVCNSILDIQEVLVLQMFRLLRIGRNMVANLIILLYWQTQRDRNIQPHFTEIFPPWDVLTFCLMLWNSNSVWCRTLTGCYCCCFICLFICLPFSSLCFSGHECSQHQGFTEIHTGGQFTHSKLLKGYDVQKVRGWKFAEGFLKGTIISCVNYASSTFNIHFGKGSIYSINPIEN